MRVLGNLWVGPASSQGDELKFRNLFHSVAF